MSDVREPIRSYQRIFRPERRIHRIEGRPLPVPGGVPLRWLAYAGAALLAVLVLSSGSPAVAVIAVLAAAGCGALLGGSAAALAAGAGALVAFWTVGLLLGLLDWPLRLVVLPLALATLATQATPDGRRADRFALSWLALRLAPRRRSLGRGLPLRGVRVSLGGRVWVAPDQHSPRLRRGRVLGPGAVSFAREVRVRRRRRGLLAIGRAGRKRRGEVAAKRVAVGAGERLEVRP